MEELVARGSGGGRGPKDIAKNAHHTTYQNL